MQLLALVNVLPACMLYLLYMFLMFEKMESELSLCEVQKDQQNSESYFRKQSRWLHHFQKLLIKLYRLTAVDIEQQWESTS